MMSDDIGGAQDLRGCGAVGAADAAPVVEHGVFSADDDEAGGVPVGDLLPDGGTDEADALAEFAPVGIAVGLAEQLDLARARREVAGERAEERSLAGAVRAEDDPVLAALHAPVEPVEDERAVAMDDEAADVEDGAPLGRHASIVSGHARRLRVGECGCPLHTASAIRRFRA